MMWQSFWAGTLEPAQAILAAGAALAAALVLIATVLRPLVKLLSRFDPEKVRVIRVSRLTAVMIVTAAALAAFAYCHGTVAPADRHQTLPFQFAELVLLVGACYVGFELLLTLVSDTLPQWRGRPPVTPIYKDLTRCIVFVGILIGALKQSFPQADIGAILTTSAILSIVLGLALQESLSNVFAGIMLTVDRPYKPGEWVEIDGREGRVLDSNWRSTRILTRDDDVLYIPNSSMNRTTIVNLSAPTPKHRCRRKIGVEYGAPPNKVRSVLTAMMSHVDGVMKDPAPDVYVVDYADFAVTYELRFWIEDHAQRTRIESDVMRAAWYHLKRNGISIPFPIREVYLKRGQAERKPEQLIALLRKVDILESLEEKDLRMLADDLTSELYAKGEVVFRQGDAGTTFYIVKSGGVSVVHRSDDGIETEVAQLTPGMYFGEMSLLTGDPRSSTCRALEDAELLCLDRESFAVLLRENPPIAQSMSEVLAARSSATQTRVSQEREMTRKVRVVDEGKQKKILEKIWGIFGFRKFS
jgi:small-conductance mechanosensitive channel/CRP-like cAMP-binding protein